MTGLLALNGGREHTAGCEDIDRRLVAECGVRTPRVTVLLAATPTHRRGFKIAEAEAYWRPFGVDLAIGFTGDDGQHEDALELLSDTDLVVLAGGYPWLLHRRLGGSAVLDRIIQLWTEGVPLSGASAGAMALCQWWPRLLPPTPLRMVDAFGLIPGTVAVPHFEHFDLNRVTRLVLRHYSDLCALGLANRTALVGRDNTFTVRGAGRVSIVRRSGQQDFRSGDTLSL